MSNDELEKDFIKISEEHQRVTAKVISPAEANSLKAIAEQRYVAARRKKAVERRQRNEQRNLVSEPLKLSDPGNKNLVKFYHTEIELNPSIKYSMDYRGIWEYLKNHPEEQFGFYRKLIKEDLWFFVAFVLNVKIANHQHWVDACKMVQEGPKSNTLDLWAREHGKSTIITTAESIQAVLINPDETTAIFSYTRDAAMSFYRSIKFILAENKFLKTCFPDVLYDDPSKEALIWSDFGLRVKRASQAKEDSFVAHGLTESMPTGPHYTRRIYDDITTQDLARSPDMMKKVKENFDMSRNLGTIGGIERVIGTYYHYDDALVYIGEKKHYLTGEPLYHIRNIPATTDGSFNGPSRYMPEEELAIRRSNRAVFATQMLLVPNIAGFEKLDPNKLIEVDTNKIPKRLYKFLLVDPSGASSKRVDNRDADSWGIVVVGVVPHRDELGASDLYILDLVIDQMDLADAVRAVTDMYLRNGRILKVGVEKVAMSSMEIHIANALRAKNIFVSQEKGNLELLTPARRSKEYRIENALSWPLENGKIHINKQIPAAYKEQLKLEMKRFPFWRDDGLDVVSYAYDLIKSYRFPMGRLEDEDEEYSESLSDGSSYYERIMKKRESRTDFNGKGWKIS